MLRFHHEEWLVIGEIVPRGYVVGSRGGLHRVLNDGVIFIFTFYISLFLSVL